MKQIAAGKKVTNGYETLWREQGNGIRATHNSAPNFDTGGHPWWPTLISDTSDSVVWRLYKPPTPAPEPEPKTARAPKTRDLTWAYRQMLKGRKIQAYHGETVHYDPDTAKFVTGSGATWSLCSHDRECTSFTVVDQPAKTPAVHDIEWAKRKMREGKKVAGGYQEEIVWWDARRSEYRAKWNASDTDTHPWNIGNSDRASKRWRVVGKTKTKPATTPASRDIRWAYKQMLKGKKATWGTGNVVYSYEDGCFYSRGSRGTGACEKWNPGTSSRGCTTWRTA